MDLGVGETCAGNANRGAAPRGAHSVISPSSTETEGGALLPKVPADTWSDLDTAAEPEKAHGRSEGCITPQDMSNDGDEIHSRKLPPQLPHRASYPQIYIAVSCNTSTLTPCE